MNDLKRGGGHTTIWHLTCTLCVGCLSRRLDEMSKPQGLTCRRRRNGCFVIDVHHGVLALLRLRPRHRRHVDEDRIGSTAAERSQMVRPHHVLVLRVIVDARGPDGGHLGLPVLLHQPLHHRPRRRRQQHQLPGLQTMVSPVLLHVDQRVHHPRAQESGRTRDHDLLRMLFQELRCQ